MRDEEFRANLDYTVKPCFKRKGEKRKGKEKKGSREQEEGWQMNHSLPAGTRFQGSGLMWPEDREAPAEESSFTLSSTVFFIAAGETVS